jgi:6-phosphogluconolactonase
LLGAAPLRDEIDWRKIQLFWGDERFVPSVHQSSNFRMTTEALLRHVPIPAENVHRIQTEARSPEEAAILYQRVLQAFYGAAALDPKRPLFDVTLLGLGADGHTASLFPDTSALDERRALATAVTGAAPEPRITLTYPALESRAVTLFLVSDAGKKEILARLLANDRALTAARLSAQPIRVLADRAALGP